jgi:hypothetical protein
MKQLLLSILVLSLAGIVTYGFKAKTAPGHKYTLTLTEEEWNSTFRYIGVAKLMLQKSTAPANEVSNLTDSLTWVQTEINQQVGYQMRADTLKKK